MGSFQLYKNRIISLGPTVYMCYPILTKSGLCHSFAIYQTICNLPLKDKGIVIFYLPGGGVGKWGDQIEIIPSKGVIIRKLF